MFDFVSLNPFNRDLVKDEKRTTTGQTPLEVPKTEHEDASKPYTSITPISTGMELPTAPSSAVDKMVSLQEDDIIYKEKEENIERKSEGDPFQEKRFDSNDSGHDGENDSNNDSPLPNPNTADNLPAAVPSIRASDSKTSGSPPAQSPSKPNKEPENRLLAGSEPATNNVTKTEETKPNIPDEKTEVMVRTPAPLSKEDLIKKVHADMTAFDQRQQKILALKKEINSNPGNFHRIRAELLSLNRDLKAYEKTFTDLFAGRDFTVATNLSGFQDTINDGLLDILREGRELAAANQYPNIPDDLPEEYKREAGKAEYKPEWVTKSHEQWSEVKDSWTKAQESINEGEKNPASYYWGIFHAEEAQSKLKNLYQLKDKELNSTILTETIIADKRINSISKSAYEGLAKYYLDNGKLPAIPDKLKEKGVDESELLKRTRQEAYELLRQKLNSEKLDDASRIKFERMALEFGQEVYDEQATYYNRLNDEILKIKMSQLEAEANGETLKPEDENFLKVLERETRTVDKNLASYEAFVEGQKQANAGRDIKGEILAKINASSGEEKVKYQKQLAEYEALETQRKSSKGKISPSLQRRKEGNVAHKRILEQRRAELASAKAKKELDKKINDQVKKESAPIDVERQKINESLKAKEDALNKIANDPSKVEESKKLQDELNQAIELQNQKREEIDKIYNDLTQSYKDIFDKDTQIYQDRRQKLDAELVAVNKKLESEALDSSQRKKNRKRTGRTEKERSRT